MLDEQLDIITGLWATPLGETFDYDGTHYRVDDSPALPKPRQQPHPPIIVGGHGAKRTPRSPRSTPTSSTCRSARSTTFVHAARPRASGVRGDRARSRLDRVLGRARAVRRSRRGRVRATCRGDRPRRRTSCARTAPPALPGEVVETLRAFGDGRRRPRLPPDARHRRPRPPRARSPPTSPPTSEVRAAVSGGEAVDAPARRCGRVERVAQPVVQAVLAALPELDDLRDARDSRPSRGGRGTSRPAKRRSISAYCASSSARDRRRPRSGRMPTRRSGCPAVGCAKYASDSASDRRVTPSRRCAPVGAPRIHANVERGATGGVDVVGLRARVVRVEDEAPRARRPRSSTLRADGHPSGSTVDSTIAFGST